MALVNKIFLTNTKNNKALFMEKKMNTTQLAICPGYDNCLTRIEKYVSDTCIYLRVLTGKLSGGIIAVSKESIVAIPDSNNLTIIQHVWGNEPLDIVKF